ncbi:putative pentatricopeptide repeat-containing protein At1g53330 [Euphorbia lathyris]|uniref:putative pentatricopeptide repeat-containing protein At1g53330 n=1 Tax=Euphorbia lathyris TaxID=212925 RepID=UPI0033143BC0
MSLQKTISSFRLSSLLRMQKDPKLALNLFRNPNPTLPICNKPFHYSLLNYDLIITKLGRAKMFNDMEEILLQLKGETRFAPKEAFFCNIITFYGRSGLLNNALKVLDEMPNFSCQRTVKSYNSLLNVFMMCKKFDMMRELFVDIEAHSRPDTCTYNILIRGLTLEGRLDDAWKLFDEMRKRDVIPDSVTFGTLINGLCLESRLEEAFKLKKYMVEVHGVSPDRYVYTSLIKGLFRVGEVDSAFVLKEEMVRDGVKLDAVIYSTLLDGLLKVGRKEEAFGVVEELKSKGCKPDIVTYNVIINGLCKDKDFETAYKILEEMKEKGCKPDIISYNVILSELCKDGKWSEAKDLFEDMPKLGCAPDVVSYRIIFDALCNGMQFKEATFVLDEMIFKGFAPRSPHLCKFVNLLFQERLDDLLVSVLTILGKADLLDMDFWEMILVMEFKDNIMLPCSSDPTLLLV